MKNNSVFVTNSFLLETLAPEAARLAKNDPALQSVASLSAQVSRMASELRETARQLGRPDIADSLSAIIPVTGNRVAPIAANARRVSPSENLSMAEIKRMLNLVDTADSLEKGNVKQAIRSAGGIMEAQNVAQSAVVASLSRVLPGHKIRGG